MLLFPNFQRSFGLILTPKFLSDRKGKSLYFNTQIYFDFFEIYFLKIYWNFGVNFRRTNPFLFGSAKVSNFIQLPNLLITFFKIYLRK